MEAIERPLADIFSKLPAFPISLKEAIRKFYPWILLIFSALGLLALLAFLGLFSAISVLAFASAGWSITGIGMIDSYVLTPLSLLFGILGGFWMLSGKKMGWDFALYNALMGTAIALIHFRIGSILWNILVLWALFQIREYFVAGDAGTGSM